MSAAKDLADWLISQGRGTSIGQDVYVNFVPDTPDSVLVLSDTGGPAASFAFGSLERVLRKLAVQILVRRMTGREAEAEAETIHGLLDGWLGADIGGHEYIFARCLESAPFLLERDNRQRVTFAFNLVAYRIREQ